MNRALIWLFLLSVISLTSCEQSDPSPGTPSYLRIESIDFANANQAVYGSSGSSITDAWVFANEKLIGVFELPCEVPILSSGNTEIRVGAGIKVNGISATRAINPFYTYYTQTVNLIPDSAVTISPVVDYSPGTKIAWKEDFEDSSVSIDTLSSSDVKLERVALAAPDNTFGGFISKAEVNADNKGLKAITDQNYPLPQDGSPVYLEVDFSSNQTLVLSIINEEESGFQQEQILIYLNPTSEGSEKVWKHLYLDLTDQVGFAIDAYKFGIGVTAFHNSATDTGYVFLDNLKLVYL